MQRGQVDIVIVGCDRVSANGDVCNKIGTYLKALAAHDNGVPFYVAMPLSTLDAALHDGLAQIPIEERSARELTHISGRDAHGAAVEVQLAPDGTAAANPAFDVTPARLVTGLITERGVVAAQRRCAAPAAGAQAMNDDEDTLRRAGGGGDAPAGRARAEPRQHRQPEPALHTARARRHADHAHRHGRRRPACAGHGVGGLRRHGAWRLAALVGVAFPPGRAMRAAPTCRPSCTPIR